MFCSVDILIGAMIYKIQKSLFYSNLYLFNFLVLNISTRGNADQLVAFFVMCCIYFLYKRETMLAAFFYGIAVHFKIYPIIYSLALFLLIDETYSNESYWKERIKFTLCSAFTCIFLIYIFYLKFGYTFLFETYLYHISRSDMRHNFSIYFYQIYLSQSISKLQSIITFLPQIIILLTISFRYYKDITFTIFIQTFIFVTFNKVITVQVIEYN